MDSHDRHEYIQLRYSIVTIVTLWWILLKFAPIAGIASHHKCLKCPLSERAEEPKISCIAPFTFSQPFFVCVQTVAHKIFVWNDSPVLPDPVSWAYLRSAKPNHFYLHPSLQCSFKLARLTHSISLSCIWARVVTYYTEVFSGNAAKASVFDVLVCVGHSNYCEGRTVTQSLCALIHFAESR